GARRPGRGAARRGVGTRTVSRVRARRPKADRVTAHPVLRRGEPGAIGDDSLAAGDAISEKKPLASGGVYPRRVDCLPAGITPAARLNRSGKGTNSRPLAPGRGGTCGGSVGSRRSRPAPTARRRT